MVVGSVEPRSLQRWSKALTRIRARCRLPAVSYSLERLACRFNSYDYCCNGGLLGREMRAKKTPNVLARSPKTHSNRTIKRVLPGRNRALLLQQQTTDRCRAHQPNGTSSARPLPRGNFFLPYGGIGSPAFLLVLPVIPVSAPRNFLRFLRWRYSSPSPGSTRTLRFAPPRGSEPPGEGHLRPPRAAAS